MAKYYNFILAKQIINSTKNLQSASLGIHEDWFWTADKVYDHKKGFLIELNQDTKIGGLVGSRWGTPVPNLTYQDETVRTIQCFTGEPTDTLEKIEQEMFWASGCLSEPIQRQRDDIEIENLRLKN